MGGYYMEKLRYKCICLDHDDTTVNSSREINYPAWVDTLSKLRPGARCSYEEFMSYCSSPGFGEYCTEIMGFNEAEMDIEFKNWLEFVRRVTPSVVSGIDRLVARQRAAGGYVAVVSHSLRENILRDWRERLGCEPDMIYDWGLGEGKRKPCPYPIYDIAERLGCEVSEILMVDDLSQGMKMARAAGCDFAFAGWADAAADVRAALSAAAEYAPLTVDELIEAVFGV